MNGRVQGELRKYWSDTLLLQGHIDLILSPIHELHQEYNQLLLEYRKTVFEKGYDEGKRLVIRELKKNRFALKSEPVTIKYESNELFGTIRETERMLEQDTFTATETTLSRVDKNINKILTDGYKEGKGIKEVSNRIKQRFNQLETWEANRIARTEIHSSHSLGRRQSYLDLDVEYVEWSSAHDKRVRGHKKTDLANHMIMDGEIKPINEKYSNGLLYPGDKSGRIEEWVNCRCSEAPVIMPPDKMAPVGQTQFREADMVSVAPVDTDRLLRRATGGKLGWSEFRKVLGGASVESVVRGAAVEATKEPTPKPKPKVDIDNVLKDVLSEYGLNKPKTKQKPKKTKTKPKSKPEEQPTITLKEHLRNELPSEFTDEGLDYIVDKVKKRANAKREYGQIFDFKTGRKTSPEFKGGKSAVGIKEEDWIKPVRQMTREEQLDALSNPQKYKRSYVKGSNNLASIHNHPSDGSRAFSGADIFLTCTNKWENYGLAISDKEIWCSEFKGTMSSIEAKDIEKKIDRLFTKSKKQARKKVMAEYDHLPYKEKRAIESELLKDIFGDNLLDLVNVKNKQWGIKLRRVRYVE